MSASAPDFESLLREALTRSTRRRISPSGSR